MLQWTEVQQEESSPRSQSSGFNRNVKAVALVATIDLAWLAFVYGLNR